MTVATPPPVVREAGPSDAEAVGAALRDYLVQTEIEKSERGAGRLSASGDLPAAYRREVENPADALTGCRILVAELDDTVVGVAVLKPRAASAEIKRLWASPGVRGRGVGSALLDAAIAAAGAAPVTLTVWDWRAGVIGLYESRGFVRVASWDARPRLVCMRRDAAHSAPETPSEDR
ncbi:GNAT family N-acetyltransferase [Microbacterium sp. JZ31]|uniref:GNAT family N-acetyltransferase n=1 Tax=Microbacterium sp. JZ31 TaxID=1906274 RepID=UPI001EE3CE43|nr:GNAT family N-acetyltransferase [Microbacterium sp. JZ31]